MEFTHDELKRRAFERVSLVLFSFWEEQKDNDRRLASVHSRIFDTLVRKEYIEINKKSADRSYPEHVVPCAYIRNHAFKMFWDGRTTDEVADMIGRLLRIAYIRKQEAKILDAVHKDTMPGDWDPDEGSILRRLEDAGIEVRDSNGMEV